MFDYDKLSKYYKDIVDKNISKYFNTFDNSIETSESIYYKGEYNTYGFVELILGAG